MNVIRGGDWSGGAPASKVRGLLMYDGIMAAVGRRAD